MIGTITLNPSIDRHLIVEGLVRDDANRAIAVREYPGGKGINVSKVVCELRTHTRAFALLGGLAGEMLKGQVAELGIPLSCVEIKGETRINTILTDVKDRTQTRISSPGPKMRAEDIHKFRRLLLSQRPKPFWWVLGGSLSAGMPASTYRDIIRILQNDGVPCVLDTDNEALAMGITAKPFMIKPNEYELERLFGRSFKTIDDYLVAGKSLVRKGISIVVISLGAKGALFVTQKEAFHALAPKVPVKSKVGAGDSLIGGVAVGLSQKLSLKRAAALGIAASTSAVMREAPRLCMRADIPKLLPRVLIREL